MKNIYKELSSIKLEQIGTAMSQKFANDNMYFHSLQAQEDSVLWTLGTQAQERNCDKLINLYKELISEKMGIIIKS